MIIAESDIGNVIPAMIKTGTASAFGKSGTTKNRGVAKRKPSEIAFPPRASERTPPKYLPTAPAARKAPVRAPASATLKPFATR